MVFKNILVSKLLVYRNMIAKLLIHQNIVCWPCILWPCLTPLLVLETIFADFLGFSPYTIMLLVKKASFISSLSICLPLITISYLIVLDRTSTMKLNRSGESVFPCLVHSLRRKVFNLSSLTMLFAVGFLENAFQQAEKVSFYS